MSVSAVIDKGMITISEGRKQKRDRDTGLCRQKEVSHVETVSQSGAPGKSGRAVFAVCSPRPPLGSFTQEMGRFLGRQGLDGRAEKQRYEAHAGYRLNENPSGRTMPRRRGLQPISSEPAPSHRPWASARATPGGPRWQQPERSATAASSSGHRSARSSLVGRLP